MFPMVTISTPPTVILPRQLVIYLCRVILLIDVYTNVQPTTSPGGIVLKLHNYCQSVCNVLVISRDCYGKLNNTSFRAIDMNTAKRKQIIIMKFTSFLFGYKVMGRVPKVQDSSQEKQQWDFFLYLCPRVNNVPNDNYHHGSYQGFFHCYCKTHCKCKLYHYRENLAFTLYLVPCRWAYVQMQSHWGLLATVTVR